MHDLRGEINNTRSSSIHHALPILPVLKWFHFKRGTPLFSDERSLGDETLRMCSYIYERLKLPSICLKKIININISQNITIYTL